jgi:hypothetical protein
MFALLRQRSPPGCVRISTRAAAARCRRLIVANAYIRDLRAGRQPPAAEPVYANVGIVAEQLLEHERQPWIRGQRSQLVFGQRVVNAFSRRSSSASGATASSSEKPAMARTALRERRWPGWSDQLTKVEGP